MSLTLDYLDGLMAVCAGRAMPEDRQSDRFGLVIGHQYFWSNNPGLPLSNPTFPKIGSGL